MLPRYYVDKVDRWGLVIRDRSKVIDVTVARGETPRQTHKIVAAHIESYALAGIMCEAANGRDD